MNASLDPVWGRGSARTLKQNGLMKMMELSVGWKASKA